MTTPISGDYNTVSRASYVSRSDGTTAQQTVAVADSSGSLTETTVSVLASSTAVIAANTARKSLILQNNDPSTTIYVDLTGGTATTTKGLRLNSAGGSATLDGALVPLTAVTAISTAGPSASNLLVIEGL